MVTPTILHRLASMSYEALLLLGVLSATFLAPHLLIGVLFQLQAPGLFLIGHVFLVLMGYFVWFWVHGGQTLAMQTWHIRLVDARSNQAIGIKRAVLRYLLSWPSLLLYGAGLVWAPFDPERQFLHDRLAGTRLVMAENHPTASAAPPTTTSPPPPAEK